MEQPKILIVDDDPELRRGLNLRLRANHYDTAYATDGVSAMAMAQKEKPDLIILDIGLPAGDGYVVLDRLQENATLVLHSGDCADGSRSPIQQRQDYASGRNCLLPKTRRQLRIAGRHSIRAESKMARDCSRAIVGLKGAKPSFLKDGPVSQKTGNARRATLRFISCSPRRFP